MTEVEDRIAALEKQLAAQQAVNEALLQWIGLIGLGACDRSDIVTALQKALMT